MTRPFRLPFKVNSTTATLRYTDRRGQQRVVSGRRHYLIGRIVCDAVLTGWGHDFEMRLHRTGPWHPVRITPDEAAAYLASHPLTRGRLKILRARPDYTGPPESPSGLHPNQSLPGDPR